MMAWIVIVGKDDGPAATYLCDRETAEEAEEAVKVQVGHNDVHARAKLAESAAKILKSGEIKQWLGDGRPPRWDGSN